jgi:hypothetical protein
MLRAMRLSQVTRAAALLVSSTRHVFKGGYAERSIIPAACGQAASTGYTAAMNLLSFGAPQGSGPGDACGRCFSITGTVDPSTGSHGSFSTIVVKVTDLCTDGQYCEQTLSNTINSINQPVQCVKTFSPFFVGGASA